MAIFLLLIGLILAVVIGRFVFSWMLRIDEIITLLQSINKKLDDET